MSETPTKSICFGIITAGDCRIETMMSLYQTVQQITVPTSLVVVKGCYMERNRNEMIKKALETGATHLMSIDTDMVFSGDAVEKLLTADKDIVGANYNKRQVPLTPIVKEPITELSQVEFTPGGFVLINMDVFKKIPSPWFVTEYGQDNQFVDDDLHFCRTARKAGFEVWCDPTIKVGHIGTIIF